MGIESVEVSLEVVEMPTAFHSLAKSPLTLAENVSAPARLRLKEIRLAKVVARPPLVTVNGIEAPATCNSISAPMAGTGMLSMMPESVQRLAPLARCEPVRRLIVSG